MKNSPEKEAYFARPRIDIAGSAADPHTHIYQLGEDGLMLRYADFTADKPGEPVEIWQITDLHLNALNARDIEENNPVIVSTRQYRMWCRDEESVPNADRAMAVSAFVDQTVVTGDTLDYLTWGTIDLLEKHVWAVDPEAIVTMGGHDITRKMQGLVDDPTTLESRYDILAKYWRHDMWYSEKVLKDRVMIIQLNNGEGRYIPSQAEQLKKSLEKARREKLIVFIFQHEPISTHNPAETDVTPMRINDGSGTRDFCGHFLGSELRPDDSGTYDLIVSGADVIRGVFCGHWHSDFYTEIIATRGEGGEQTVIPQYVLTGTPYDFGHGLLITVK